MVIPSLKWGESMPLDRFWQRSSLPSFLQRIMALYLSITSDTPPPPLFQCHRSIVSFSSSLRSSCIIGYGSTFNKLGRLLPMYQSYPSLAPQATMDVTRPYIGVYSSGNTQRYLSNTSRVISHVPGCFIQKVRKTTFSKVHEQKLERTDQVSLLTSCPRLWNAR